MKLLCPAFLALAAFLSLQPYFIWTLPRTTLICSIITAAIVVILLMSEKRRRGVDLESIGVCLIAAFVVDITIERTTQGGHIKWVFVLPMLVACRLMTEAQRRTAIGWFAGIFAVTLTPGIAYWILAAVGRDLSFDLVSTPNVTMATTQNVNLLIANGAVFIETNRILTWWGGSIFRLCGSFDEPGTVGTISALLIAALHYRFSDWRVFIAFIGGILSFSLAFFALTTLGILLSAIAARRLNIIASLPPVLLAGYFSIGLPIPSYERLVVSSRTETAITVRKGGESWLLDAPQRGGGRLRQSQSIDNRIHPEMRELISEYFRSDWPTIAVGIASDASVARDPVSQTWMRILTDHGILGFLLLVGGCAAIAASTVKHRNDAWKTAIFFLLFAMSAYQRPVVWMPYTLLLLLCGGSHLRTNHLSQRWKAAPGR